MIFINDGSFNEINTNNAYLKSIGRQNSNRKTVKTQIKHSMFYFQSFNATDSLSSEYKKYKQKLLKRQRIDKVYVDN